MRRKHITFLLVFYYDAGEHVKVVDDAHDEDGGDQDEGADDAAREVETDRSQVFCDQGSNGR